MNKFKIVMADDGIKFDGRTPAIKPLGGAESGFVNLAEALAARGHEVIAFTNPPDNEELNKKSEDSKADKADSSDKEGFELKGVIWRSIHDNDALADMGPDLYIAHRGDKLINAVPKAKTIVFLIQNPAKYLLKWRYLWKLATVRPIIVFIGYYHARTYPKWAPPWGKRANGEKYRKVIPFGISEPFISARPNEKALENKRAIFTSNPLRGLNWLLDLWAKRIHPHVPDAELHIFSGTATYGDKGNKKAREINRRLKKARSLEKKGVVLRDPVGKEELCKELCESRVMLYKGDVNETFCFSLAEAQAAGLPCIVKPIGSVVERILHGKTGIITKSNKEFARKAVSILTDDSYYKELSESALLIQKQRNWDVVASEYEKLIVSEMQ